MTQLPVLHLSPGAGHAFSFIIPVVPRSTAVPNKAPKHQSDEEEEKRVQVLVVQEAEHLEEEPRSEESVQVLHNCQVNMTQSQEISD